MDRMRMGNVVEDEWLARRSGALVGLLHIAYSKAQVTS